MLSLGFCREGLNVRCNIHTKFYGLHSSKAASIAVSGHNNDSVHYIVRQNDWNTCCIGDEWTKAWTNCHGVVDWSPTIILWELPLHCKDGVACPVLLNSKRGSPRRREETYRNEEMLVELWVAATAIQLTVYVP